MANLLGPPYGYPCTERVSGPAVTRLTNLMAERRRGE
jgi:hypothetical protein